jgi:hypothetical protein
MDTRHLHTKLIIRLIILTIVMVLGGACAVSNITKQSSESQNGGLVIQYLNAPKQVQPLKGAEVLCVATDDSNKDITYEWSTTGGEIKQKGDNEALVLWIAPEKTGDYTVTVVVTNAKGNKATRSATINVGSEPYQKLTVTSMNCYGCTNGIEASRFKNYEIRCVV